MPLIVATYVCHAARLQHRTGSARTSLGPILGIQGILGKLGILDVLGKLGLNGILGI
jgi:hypothetical protein